ncbi:MAG: hypothetical protein OXI66_02260, partial [Boseongicola sp.]|nr:hypothetical protein [Boseongicola sp.]
RFLVKCDQILGQMLSDFAMVLEDVAEYPGWPRTVAWKIPFVVPRFGIFLGFLLMGIYTAIHLYVSVRRGPVETREA